LLGRELCGLDRISANRKKNERECGGLYGFQQLDLHGERRVRWLCAIIADFAGGRSSDAMAIRRDIV
jgi:hypothetical protein